MNNQSEETLSGKDYLTGNFSRELNYKMWSTKGARFIAAQRLRSLDKLSVISVSFLSSYLIVFNIADKIVFKNCIGYDQNIFFILNIFMSIAILSMTLIISKEEYSKRSERHHQCGLDIGKLYKKLRIAKTMGEKKELKSELIEIDKEYQLVLEKYENHTPIDRKKFLAGSRHYESNDTTTRQAIWYNLLYWTHVYSIHILILIIPPIVLGYSLYSVY